MLAVPTQSIESKGFSTWSVTNQELSFPQLAPGPNSGEWLGSGSSSGAGNSLYFVKVTYDGAGTITQAWNKSISCSAGKTCTGMRLFPLPKVDKDYVYTGWSVSGENKVNIAKLSNTDGAVQKVISIPQANLDRFGVCFGWSNFLLFVFDTTGKVYLYTIGGDLVISTQYTAFDSIDISCHPLFGTDTQFISSMTSNGTVTVAKLTNNSTKAAEYTLAGIDNNYSMVIEGSGTRFGLRYYKKETGTSNATNFGFAVMDPDTFEILTAQDFVQTVDSPIYNATFSGDNKYFAFSFGNRINQSSRTLIIDLSDNGIEMGFQAKFGTANASMAPAAIVFTPGGSTVLNFIGSFGVGNSSTQINSLSGAFQVVDLESCGGGFEEYKPTLTTNKDLGLTKVTSGSTSFNPASSVSVTTTDESTDIFNGTSASFTDSKSQVATTQYCPSTTTPNSNDSAVSLTLEFCLIFSTLLFAWN
eukprot:CAMPEP_0115006728 /NCGR_PEP_ID=MMETSP0216-20121206/20688_1 /TAXON_ID=223996 /ORGANISM="Protocruzia adherens, Strain Boccale" /LENGTH=471 /DNA_ID=CAMNT_0002373397 /DNA_START=34 /DNA_END=1449 /DNA_ORIENTATION=-